MKRPVPVPHEHRDVVGQGLADLLENAKEVLAVVDGIFAPVEDGRQGLAPYFVSPLAPARSISG